MKLEYRVIEISKSDKYKWGCDFCSYDKGKVSTATHEIVARKSNGYADVAYICSDCKRDFENNALPWCEKCGRVKRNRISCFCRLVEDQDAEPTSEETIIAQAYSSRLESKIKELEKELSATKEVLKIEREEIAKFHEKSEEWGRRQKDELLDKTKQQEAEIERLKKLTPQGLINEVESYKEEVIRLKIQLEKSNSQQSAQIEVRKWPWLKIRK